ncbi:MULTISPECIES: hypothetical protein [unclassified Arthrobacter]|nr:MULTISPECIES: hypothetical protein [unclassified Arthrobacter]
MRGVSRVLGSVANRVAHHALCDVYLANTYDARHSRLMRPVR